MSSRGRNALASVTRIGAARRAAAGQSDASPITNGRQFAKAHRLVQPRPTGSMRSCWRSTARSIGSRAHSSLARSTRGVAGVPNARMAADGRTVREVQTAGKPQDRLRQRRARPTSRSTPSQRHIERPSRDRAACQSGSRSSDDRGELPAYHAGRRPGVPRWTIGDRVCPNSAAAPASPQSPLGGLAALDDDSGKRTARPGRRVGRSATCSGRRPRLERKTISVLCRAKMRRIVMSSSWDTVVPNTRPTP